MNVCKLHSVALDRLISLILSSLLGKMEIIVPTQQCVCVWGVSFYLHNNNVRGKHQRNTYTQQYLSLNCSSKENKHE